MRGGWRRRHQQRTTKCGTYDSSKSQTNGISEHGVIPFCRAVSPCVVLCGPPAVLIIKNDVFGVSLFSRIARRFVSPGMSALGQTRRFSLGRGMSVVLPIAAMFSKFAQQQRFATAEGGYQASDLVR